MKILGWREKLGTQNTDERCLEQVPVESDLLDFHLQLVLSLLEVPIKPDLRSDRMIQDLGQGPEVEEVYAPEPPLDVYNAAALVALPVFKTELQMYEAAPLVALPVLQMCAAPPLPVLAPRNRPFQDGSRSCRYNAGIQA
jgi:hypothetical protein